MRSHRRWAWTSGQIGRSRPPKPWRLRDQPTSWAARACSGQSRPDDPGMLASGACWTADRPKGKEEAMLKGVSPIVGAELLWVLEPWATATRPGPGRPQHRPIPWPGHGHRQLMGFAASTAPSARHLRSSSTFVEADQRMEVIGDRDFCSNSPRGPGGGPRRRRRRRRHELIERHAYAPRARATPWSRLPRPAPTAAQLKKGVIFD